MSGSQNQEFCVRWNSHLGSIGAAFPQLLAGQRFVDVTLACEGHQVHCHRLVLAACSSYFEAILAENPCKHPVIILPSEIKLWEIQALVDFMYKGEVNVTQAGLPQLLRCAEQLRIRGLHGSDAALNLNQLKALTEKVSTTASSSNSIINNDSTETESSSNLTVPNAMSVPEQQQQHQQQQQQQQQQTLAIALSQQQQQQQQQQQLLLQQQQQEQVTTEQFVKKELNTFNAQNKEMQENGGEMHFKQEQSTTRSNFSSGDEDDEDSGAEYSPVHAYNQNDDLNSHKSNTAIESTDEQSYVAQDEEDSFIANAADNEHEISVNSSLMQSSIDGASASFKRVRRSEASLAQAAKCVTKGETFQTVSNMYNIPVSTIRFFMARKGILPKRKRGRGASSTGSMGIVTMHANNLPDVKPHILGENGNTLEPPFQLMAGYKMNQNSSMI